MEGTQAALERLAPEIVPGGRLVRAWLLHGGISAHITAIEIQTPDGQHIKLVVRRHGPRDLARNPSIAADEFRLLRILRAADIPVPEPRYLDERGDLLGTPFIVVDLIEGDTAVPPSHAMEAAPHMGRRLAAIHALPATNPALSFLPRQDDYYTFRLQQRPDHLDDSLQEDRIRGTLDAVWPLPPRNGAVLLHGDFWPGNLIWREGHAVAIIDWENAALGDPLADLGNSRMEAVWAFGPDAMQRFTDAYLSAATPLDLTDLPYWDLLAALRPAGRLAEWAGDSATEATMREGHRRFVAQAYEALSIQHET